MNSKHLMLAFFVLLTSACAGLGKDKALNTNAVQMADEMLLQGRVETAAAIYGQTTLLSASQRRLKLSAIAMTKRQFELAERQIQLAVQAGADQHQVQEARAWLHFYQRQNQDAARLFANLNEDRQIDNKTWRMMQAVALDLAGDTKNAQIIWQKLPDSPAKDTNFAIHIALEDSPSKSAEWLSNRIRQVQGKPERVAELRSRLAMMLIWSGREDEGKLLLTGQDGGISLIREYERLQESNEQARLLLWQWLADAHVWIPVF